MKVCIVTVYNSENCGSYWQAFALCSYLKQGGCDVSFMKRKRKGTSHSIVYVGRQTLKWILKGEIEKAKAQVQQYWAFNESIKKFKIVDEIDANFDLCIIGSDTLWNLEDQYFEDNRAIFFGEKSKAKKTITFAVSAANTSYDAFKKHVEIIDYLKKMDAIAVRDKYTSSIVRKLLGKVTPIVVDPTMLLEKTEYQRYCIDLQIDKFIFVYYFGRIPDDLQNKIREYANSKKLKIVVMGHGMKGDYKFDVFSPRVFISCFNKADYVVTNTFHGVMFTLIFEKQAVFNSCGKEKVKDVMNEYGLNDSDYSENMAINLINNNIDYNRVKIKLNENKLAAKEYINAFIGGRAQ